MATTGFLFPTTDTAVSGTWVTPANVQADDTINLATTAPAQNATASRDAGGFGFSTAVLPVGSDISKVEFKSAYLLDTALSIATLRFNANVAGTILADHDDGGEPLSRTVTTFDITADRAWSAADFRDGTFFVRLNGLRGNSIVAVIFSFDYVAVQVTFTAPVANLNPGVMAVASARRLYLQHRQEYER